MKENCTFNFNRHRTYIYDVLGESCNIGSLIIKIITERMAIRKLLVTNIRHTMSQIFPKQYNG